jgi:Zn-dependent metalloprotease
MKTLFIMLISVALFSNCKKDVTSCKEYKQLEIQENPIDTNTIDIPEFKALLAQYSCLKPYEFKSDPYSWLMKCNVSYKGIPVLMQQYAIVKSKETNEVKVMDTLRTYDLPLSTEPGISYNDAIKEAKKVMNFDHTCIFYSLGIYEINRSGTYNPDKFILVWKIEGAKGYPLVILDANTKRVYVNSDGIIIN